MPRYDFKCTRGHITELTCSMGAVPPVIACDCNYPAYRVFAPPAAIHFHGPGFYSTDVKGTLRRRRRPNPGDDLRRDFQPDTAKIADAI